MSRSYDDIKSMNELEEKVLKYMRDEWKGQKYCNLRRILEDNLEDFQLEFTAEKGFAGECTGHKITLYTSELNLEESARFKRNNPEISPLHYKLAKKLSEVLTVYNLIEYLDQNEYIIMVEDERDIPDSVIYRGQGKKTDPSHPKPVTGHLNDLCLRFHNSAIFPEQDLVNYINDGFKTPEMVYEKRQMLNSIVAYTISVIGLLYGVAMGIIAALK